MPDSSTAPVRSICVASGKGGVGKTSFSVNLALALAAMEKRVLLFDGDMGLANAQIALNCKLPPVTLGDAASTGLHLSQLVIPTGYGIDLLPGANGSGFLAAMDRERSLLLAREFGVLAGNYDLLIVDSSAGISPSVLAFLEASAVRLIIGTNDPASITDAYGLIKALVSNGITDDIHFISNRCNPTDGKRLFERMEQVVQHFLQAQLQFGGSISHDSYMDLCWKKSVPIVAMAPHSQVAQEIVQIALRLMQVRPRSTADGTIRFFG